MLAVTIIFIISLAALLISADKFVDCSIKFAERLKISKKVIGLTCVAVGTSLPEVSASVFASYEGHSDISIGNVVGSNICNIALVLALPAVWYGSIRCELGMLKREGVFMFLLSISVWMIALYFGEISRLLGVILFLGFLGFVYFVFKYTKTHTDEYKIDQGELSELTTEAMHLGLEGQEPERTTKFLLGLMLISLVVLLMSSHYLVYATVEIAKIFNISEGVIALSLVAFGTSVPELSVSIAAVRRKQGDILVSNILGSNITNMLLVLGASAIIRPLTVSYSLSHIDMPIMIATAALMVVFLVQKDGITRGKAAFLLAVYAAVIARFIYL